MSKPFEAVARFLEGLESPTVRGPLLSDPVVVEASKELQRRQARYRRLFVQHANTVCATCRFGGCCKNELVRVADVLARLAIEPSVPRPSNQDAAACSFLGEHGCLLASSVMPMMCVSFHCSDLYVRPTPDFARQSVNLASHGEDIATLLRTHLLNQFVLADAEGRLDIMSPVVSLAPLVKGQVRLLAAPSGLPPNSKSTPHSVELVKLHRLPSVPT